jgi:hypothetical protein
LANDMPGESLNTDLEAFVRERAYQLWQSEGCPDGRGEEYWHRAREMIEAEAQTHYPPTQSRANRT